MPAECKENKYPSEATPIETQPAVTMTHLGRNDRFGDQLFQYAFLKCYATRHGYRLETPQWVGQQLYGFDDPPPTRTYPMVIETNVNFLASTHKPTGNVDFWGHFRYPTDAYAPFKPLIREVFRPLTRYDDLLQHIRQFLTHNGKTLVALHLNSGTDDGRGDLKASTQWAYSWLKSIWEDLDTPVLYVVSDDSKTAESILQEFEGVMVTGLGMVPPELAFWIDFWVLSQADWLCIANNTVSMAAALLNEVACQFVRPHPGHQSMVAFDPWDAPVLLTDYCGPATPGTPISPPELVSDAAAWIAQGDLPAAIDCLQRALVAAPQGSTIQYELSKAYRLSGMGEKALAHCLQACQLDPGSYLFQAELADLYFQQDRLQQALEVYHRLLSQFHNHVPTILRIGEICVCARKMIEGRRFFERAMTLDPFFKTADPKRLAPRLWSLVLGQ